MPRKPNIPYLGTIPYIMFGIVVSFRLSIPQSRDIGLSGLNAVHPGLQVGLSSYGDTLPRNPYEILQFGYCPRS